MSSKFEDIGTLKVGSYMIMDGAPCKITKMDRSKPGKHGHAKFRVEAVGLLDNTKRCQIFSHDKIEVPIIEKRSAQVLSISGDKAQVMDLESYETFDALISEDLAGKVEVGKEVVYWDIIGTKVIKQAK